MLAERTVDGFLDNSFSIIQPKDGAHRAGLDAILLAATVPADAKGRLADFGSGSGAAGFAVVQRCPDVHVDLIELDHETAEMARDSIKLPVNQHLQSRLSVIEGDLMAASAFEPNTYGHIIANPPFNSEAYQASPNADRSRAHSMDPSLLQSWIKAAAHAGKPKGKFTLILRPDSLSEALSSLAGAFGNPKIIPVHPKPDATANRLLVSARKGGKGALQILPPLILHRGPSFTDEAEAIFRGRASLSI